MTQQRQQHCIACLLAAAVSTAISRDDVFTTAAVVAALVVTLGVVVRELLVDSPTCDVVSCCGVVARGDVNNCVDAC